VVGSGPITASGSSLRLLACSLTGAGALSITSVGGSGSIATSDQLGIVGITLLDKAAA
jgi:hypothetical protein